MENIPYELIARYLAGECNAEEIRQIQEWSEQHPEMMDEFTRLWEQIPSGDFNPDVEKALENVNYRIDIKRNRHSRRIRMITVASCAAAIVAVVILVLVNITGSRNQNPLQDIKNASGLLSLYTDENQTLEYELPDGSTVWLNRSSSLKYPEVFEGNTREVYLEGEAFFDISPDKEKPFIIHANNTLTRVVGTSFGIKAVKNSKEVVVTVSTGIINFSAEGKSGHIELKKGEQGICEPEQKKLEKNANPDPNLLAWKTKKLVFKQTPLTEVAKVIENSYHTPVSVDNSLTDLQITSTFDQLSLDEIMEIIEITLQIKAETNENGILFTVE